MLYDYQCRKCGEVRLNHHNKLDERHTHAPMCCDERMSIAILTAPMAHVDNLEPYKCVATNEVITSRRQRNYMMDKNGYMDFAELGITREDLKERSRKAREEKAEIQALKDAIPEDLKRDMDRMVKQEEDKFKTGL